MQILIAILLGGGMLASGILKSFWPLIIGAGIVAITSVARSASIKSTLSSFKFPESITFWIITVLVVFVVGLLIWVNFDRNKSPIPTTPVPTKRFVFHTDHSPKGMPTEMKEVGSIGESPLLRFRFRSATGWKEAVLKFNPKTGFYEGVWGEGTKSLGTIRLGRISPTKWEGQMKDGRIASEPAYRAWLLLE